MIRNDYRRAFIMLRAVMPGYGGHVRLERRTLTGSMYFIITAPQGVGELAAALVGRQDGAYYAAPIGPLARDRRGQLALAWQFDPRDIGGRPLEAYAWVAVVATGGPCALALTGNVEGSREVDAWALERAACALFTPAQGDPGGRFADARAYVGGEAPAADLPEREAAGDVLPIEAAEAGEGTGDSGGANATASYINDSAVSDANGAESDAPAGETRGDVRVYTMTRARLRRLAARGDAEVPAKVATEGRAGTAGTSTQAATEGRGETAGEPSQAVAKGWGEAAGAPAQASTKAQTGTEGASAQSATEGRAGTAGEPSQAVAEGRGGAAEASPVTAAKRLGLDITAPWPGVAESLRRLFATQVPAVDAPRDGFTYVRAPMPAAAGYPDSLAGLSVRDGRIAAVRHALPARRTPEPPAGMEAYTWLPGEGELGFWVTEEGVG